MARKPATEEREASFQNFETARTCLLFCIEGERSAAEIQKLRSALEKKMKVDTLLFRGATDPAGTGEVKKAIYMSEDDVSLAGKLANARLQEIIHFPYDLLVDLSRDADSVGDYLLRCSAAKCKIGIERSGFQCDIVFEGITEVEELWRRLNELLKQIKAY
ncbi:MAG: hypothetical protein LBG30_02155 [Odoribacteraceae bacterium]|nr:hypothetical protein [Odoribacteraceae bacterium]